MATKARHRWEGWPPENSDERNRLDRLYWGEPVMEPVPGSDFYFPPVLMNSRLEALWGFRNGHDRPGPVHAFASQWAIYRRLYGTTIARRRKRVFHRPHGTPMPLFEGPSGAALLVIRMEPAPRRGSTAR